MIPAMPLPATSHTAPQALARGAAQWLSGWWRIIHLGGVLLALALTPTTYRGDDRAALARHVWLGCAPLIPWFALLSALISLVLIRIVVVTAVSYGLSQVRARDGGARAGAGADPAHRGAVRRRRAAPCRMRRKSVPCVRRGSFEASRAQGRRRCARGAAARRPGVFCALMLAAVSCVVALVIAYLAVYGFTPGASTPTRAPSARCSTRWSRLVFSLKILLLGLAVALIPIAAVLYDLPWRAARRARSCAGWCACSP